MARANKAAPAAAALATALGLGACSYNPMGSSAWGWRQSLSERECMARAMYFESNRSSEDGMLAVGTVVMNRMQSGRYPSSACGVVGQPNQFAQGALSKPVSGRSWALALRTADSVLAGQRHAAVQGAMHFHTAGYTFPYRNMAYVVAAGGNVFYEKRAPGTFTPINPSVLVARAAEPRVRPSERIVLARAEEVESRPARRQDLVHLASIGEDDGPRVSRIEPPSGASVQRSTADRAPVLRREPLAPREPQARRQDETLHWAKKGTGRSSLARLAEDDRADRAHFAERKRLAEHARSERIRVAQLGDDVLPRDARTKSDAPVRTALAFDLPRRVSPREDDLPRRSARHDDEPPRRVASHGGELRAGPPKPAPLPPLPGRVMEKSAKPHPSRDAGVPLAYKDAAKPKPGILSLPPSKPHAQTGAKAPKDPSKKKG